MIQGPTSQAHITSLPDELLLKIGGNLSTSSLLTLIAVSPKMAPLADKSLFQDMRLKSSHELHALFDKIDTISSNELKQDVGNAITSLTLQNASLEDKDIEAIKDRFPRLEKLNISMNKKLTADSGKALGQLTQLKELDASFCDLPSSFSQGLVESKSLEIVHMEMNKMGIDGLKDLTRIGSLQRLDYSSNRIQNRRNEAAVSDDITKLSSSISLKVLNISANDLTDRSLAPFAQNLSVQFLVSNRNKTTGGMEQNIGNHFSNSGQGRIAAFNIEGIEKVREELNK